MAQRPLQSGFTIGDGFRLGIGFAIANACIGLLAAIVWFFVLAGLFVAGAK